MRIRISMFVILAVSFAVLPLLGAQESAPPPASEAPAADGSKPAAQSALIATVENPGDLKLKMMSYCMGVSVGQEIQRRGVTLDAESICDGVRDVLNGKDLAMTKEDMDAALLELNRAIAVVAAADTLKRTNEFLAENATKEGVHVDPAGFQYVVMKEGAGSMPTPEDTVRVHMVMMSPSGEKIMDTYERDEPAVFPINQAFEGLGLALMKMNTGAKWRVFLPPNLTFRGKASPDGKVPANALAIYELELLEIVPVVQP